MKKVPKGKGRKSDAQTYADAMLCLKLADHDCLTEEQIAEKTGLSRSTVYRLLSRARSSVLAPQNKANREAAEPLTKKWFEVPDATSDRASRTHRTGDDPQPNPGEVESRLHRVVEREYEQQPPHAPDVDTRRTSVKPPQIQPYVPSPRPVRKPNEDDLTWKTRWRRWQVDEQVMENLLNGADGPVLRGRPNRSGVCFGNCPPFQCTCHDEGPFEL